MSLRLDLTGFYNQFPNHTSDKDGTAITYTVEDSDYRIYQPTQSGNVFTINLDHIRGDATDDHATLIVEFDDTKGCIKSYSGTWTAGNDGYVIPKQVIELVDTGAEILGAVGAIETAGISEEAAQAVVADFDTFCKLFNFISKQIVKLSDDGGRFYFTAVGCHAVVRLGTSVSVA